MKFKLDECDDLQIALHLVDELKKSTPTMYSTNYLKQFNFDFIKKQDLVGNNFRCLYLHLTQEHENEINHIINQTPSMRSIRLD